MMTGVLEPTSGEIMVGGNVPYRNRTKNAQEIGVVFGQRSQLWWALPLIESFKILKDIYQIPDADYDEEDEGDEDEEGEEFFYEDEVEKVRRKI